MNIIDIKPKGFCKGVMRAILLAKKVRNENPDAPITILGAIVHNHYITKALKYLNINTVDIKGKTRLEMLDYIDEGIVILSAHGSAYEVSEKAKKKGLTVVDASCEDVLSTHQVIEKALSENKQVIYIGKNGHPESEAVIFNYPNVFFIENVSDLENQWIDPNIPLIITNQTTLSLIEIKDIVFKITSLFPLAQFVNEICAATRMRQEAVINTDGLDHLIVVGDPASNNTNMLAQIGRNQGIKNVMMIESIEQLDLSPFNQDDTIGVTAGASTPRYLTQMIIDYLKVVDLKTPLAKPKVLIEHILD